MIVRDKIMVAAGGNIMRNTPQEAYDLIENMTQHHYQWDSEVQYNTTTNMSAHYSKTTFASSHPNTFHYTYYDESDEDEPSKVLKVHKSIHPLSGSPTPSSDSIIASSSPSLTPPGNSDFLLEEIDAFLALDSIPHGIDNEIFDTEGDILLLEKLLNINSIKDLLPQELNNDSEEDILFLENLLEDEPLEAKKSEIDPLIREPSDTFLMRGAKIKFNPLKDIDDPVPIPRVSEKPLGSLDSISETFDMTITNPLFDFDSKFTLNSDNPIFDIQNEESDESETETIMEEVQIYSSQSTTQIPPSYKKLTFDLTMTKPILTFSHFRYGIFGSYRVFDILGLKLLLSYGFGLVFSENFSIIHSLYLFDLGDRNEVFDPGIIVIDVDSKF
ncbi:hypothetical protein Tco_1054226 [Tanacetum coccineum]|uniref:Reverse transcriptase domain-containing protein n=1 Tax=Tanacetum coccineum TaxID=301880 RepID=A0ABQ5GWL5_9ASTR